MFRRRKNVFVRSSYSISRDGPVYQSFFFNRCVFLRSRLIVLDLLSLLLHPFFYDLISYQEILNLDYDPIYILYIHNSGTSTPAAL